MSHFNLNITSIPVYNDGTFFLFEISHTDDSFPVEKIRQLYDKPFFYQELSLTDNVIFENDKRDKKIVLKIRISQDRDITSQNVLKINDEYYQVFNIYHFKNKDGYLQSDITLQEYPNPELLGDESNDKEWFRKYI